MARTAVIVVLTTICLVSCVPFAAAATPSFTQRAGGVETVRSIDADDLGVARPSGIGYSARDGSLFVAGTRGDRTRVSRLQLPDRRRGALRLRLDRPSTLSFDPAGRRLTAVTRRERIAVAARAGARVARAGVKALELRDPRGTAFDRRGRTWFVLDGGALVRVAVRGAAKAPARIPLRGIPTAGLQGLAYNAADGLLYTIGTAPQRLYGFAADGSLRRTYDLNRLGLARPSALAFAPSADPTDHRQVQHLYIADRGRAAARGRVVEATMAPRVAFAAAAEVVPATMLRLIDTSKWSPSSPDPSGMAYDSANDRFMISDSEVEEMTLYKANNLWYATRTGTAVSGGTTVSFSKEPTGLGYRASDGTLFVSDDDSDRVHVVKPGTDGKYGTKDDVRYYFSTSAFGSTDAEGVEYDTATGNLFICDGTGKEVYEVDPAGEKWGDGNDVVTHFDIGVHGARDCEGAGLDPARQSVLSVDPTSRKIYETTKTGVLMRVIDLNPIPTTNRAFASVSVAPTSNPNDSPTKTSYWVADRQVDNGTNPNENDGKIYEVGIPTTGSPPSVTLTAPGAGATVAGLVNVAASASDDDGVMSVRFAVDGAVVGTDTNGTDGWSVPWNSTTVADGTHTLTATATDTDGQTTTSASRSVSTDNVDEPPTVALTAPAQGATVTGTVAVGANAADDYGVTQVAFSVDGTDIGVDSNGADGWSAGWNTASFDEGAHTVKATATDTSGRTSSAVRSVSVDDASPSVSLTAPASSSTVEGTVLAEATASDDVGVTRVSFKVDGTAIGVDSDGGDGWSVSWDSSTLPDGPHELTATAEDGRGQTTQDARTVITENDDAPPTVAVTAPADGAQVSGTLLVRADASDDRAVTRVTFSVDGEVVGTDHDGSDGWSTSWDSESVADGEYTLTAEATDTGSQTTSGSIAITVDSGIDTPPDVAFTAPEPGAVVGTVALRADASDNHGVTQVAFEANGTPIGTDTDGSDGYSVSWDTSAVAEGAYTLTATATDTGGQTAVAERQVTVDDASPTVGLQSPSASATVIGTVLITAGASDDVKVDRVKFLVDGDEVATDTDGADGWSASWNTAAAAEGDHTITAIATDGRGQTASDARAVAVDDASPSVTLSAPAEGAKLTGSVTVRAAASDDVGVTKVAFSVDGTVFHTDTEGTDGWSAPWSTADSGDGSHTVSATVTDTRGQTTSDSGQVTVDNTPPTVAVTAPADGATVNGALTLTATATDGDAVASVRFLVDGAAVGTDTDGANGWSVQWDSTSVANGTHTITAVARDVVGHATASAAVVVTVDNPIGLALPVRTGTDDAEESPDGSITRSSGDLELGVDQNSISMLLGIRYASVGLPQGATITAAHLQFQADERNRIATTVAIRAQQSDNAASIATTAFGLSSRPRTVASVDWSPPPWLIEAVAGAEQRTPSLVPVLQEIVDRPGWAAGNALMIMISGTGRRTAESFEGGFPPVLHVEYTRP